MQVTAPLITISVGGELTVTVTPTPSSGYVDKPFSIRVRAVGWVGPAPLHIEITYGDETSEVKDVIGDNWTFTKTYTSVAPTRTITANCRDLQTNKTGSGSASVTIKEQLTIPSFDASPKTGDAPLTVTFTFSMSGGYTPYTWTLEPEPGVSYPNPTSPKSHTYQKRGTYTAKLTVTDAQGLAIASLPISINIFGVEVVIPPEVWALVETLGVAAPIAAVLGVIVSCELKKAGVLT